MYDTYIQVISSVLVCRLLKKTFQLILQIWKVGILRIHVALVLKKYSSYSFLCFDIWFVEKDF